MKETKGLGKKSEGSISKRGGVAYVLQNKNSLRISSRKLHEARSDYCIRDRVISSQN